VKALAFLSRILILSFLFISCSDSNLTNYNSTNSNDYLSPLLVYNGSDNDVNYQFYINQSRQSILISDSDSIYNIRDPRIRHYSSVYLFSDAGFVKVGNTQIGNNGEYYTSQKTFDLNAQPINIYVQGKGKIPGFSFNLLTPLNFGEIISPEHGFDHNANNDLIVEWKPELSQNMFVIISLYSKEGKSNSGFWEKLTDDTGKFVIPASIFKKFPKGIVDICIKRGNHKYGVAPNGEKYGAFIYTQDCISILLNK